MCLGCWMTWEALSFATGGLNAAACEARTSRSWSSKLHLDLPNDFNSYPCKLITPVPGARKAPLQGTRGKRDDKSFPWGKNNLQGTYLPYVTPGKWHFLPSGMMLVTSIITLFWGSRIAQNSCNKVWRVAEQWRAENAPWGLPSPPPFPSQAPPQPCQQHLLRPKAHAQDAPLARASIDKAYSGSSSNSYSSSDNEESEYSNSARGGGGGGGLRGKPLGRTKYLSNIN